MSLLEYLNCYSFNDQEGILILDECAGCRRVRKNGLMSRRHHDECLVHMQQTGSDQQYAQYLVHTSKYAIWVRDAAVLLFIIITTSNTSSTLMHWIYRWCTLLSCCGNPRQKRQSCVRWCHDPGPRRTSWCRACVQQQYYSYFCQLLLDIDSNIDFFAFRFDFHNLSSSITTTPYKYWPCAMIRR